MQDVILECGEGCMLFEDEWGVLQGSFYGFSGGDSSCREVFTDLEDF